MYYVTCYCRVLHNANYSNELLSVRSKEAHNRVINAIEKAETAANQSREAADQTLKVTSSILDQHLNV